MAMTEKRRADGLFVMALSIFLLFDVFFIQSYASEEKFPDSRKEITLIAGYAPGGSSDAWLRLTGPYLQELLKVRVLIQNAPGSGNLVALNQAFAKRPDGYTLSGDATIDSPWVHYYLSQTTPPWKPQDWRPVCTMGSLDNTGILVKRNSPWANFTEFISDARKRPGKITVASLGPGRFDDLWMIELQEFFGVKFNWVFYDSSGSIQTDLLTGDLDAGMLGAARKDFVNHPEFRVLTLISTRELPKGYPYQFPVIKDFEKDLGFNSNDLKALSVKMRFSIITKADVPAKIINTLTESFRQINSNPKWQEEFKKFSWPYFLNSEEALKEYQAVEAAAKKFAPLRDNYKATKKKQGN